MRTIVGSLLLITMAVHLQAQEQQVLGVAPLFTNVGRGPAFILACVNTSGSPFHVMGVTREIIVRVDGKIVERIGGVAGSGGDPVVNAGETFKVMFMLDQPQLGRSFTKSPDFGALVRTGLNAPLAPGPHTLQFQCLGRSSRDIEMYWENATVPQ